MAMHKVMLAFAAASVLAWASPTHIAAHSTGPFIPGLTVQVAVDRFERFGLECVVGGPPSGVFKPPPPGLRGAGCEGEFPDSQGRVLVLMNYWPDGHVLSFESQIGAAGGFESTDVSPQFARSWAIITVRMPYAGADPNRAEDWVRNNADNAGCGQGCYRRIGQANLFMAVSIHGWPGQVSVGGLAEPPTVPDTGMAPANPLPFSTWAALGLVLVLGAGHLLRLGSGRPE